MELIRRLTDPIGCFDASTLSRGRSYVGSVSAQQLTGLEADHVTASALVAGTAAAPYVVHLDAWLEDGDLELMTICSCPVRTNCKHGAALCLAIGSRLAPAQARVSPIEALLADLDDLAPVEKASVGVALQFSLRRGSRGAGGQAGGDEVLLRPLRPGARQQWVKSGLAWSDVPSAVRHSGSLDQAQLRALNEIRTVAFPDYWYSRHEPSLHDLGAGAVRLLTAARNAGVTFVPVAPLASIEIADEPLGLVVDARADGDTTVLRVGLRHGARIWSGPSITAIGDPAATVTLLDEGRLVVAGLEPALPAGPVRSLRREGPITISEPPDDILRRLRVLVPVGSDDGTVQVPEPVLPGLRVRVTWLSGSQAEVRWMWVYGDHPPYGLTTAAPPGVVRDVSAERELLALLHPPPADDLVLVDGVDTLHLALLEIPVWRAIDGVEVVESDRPDFRESDAVPEVSFVTPGPPDSTADAAVGTPTDWLDLEVVLTIEGERLPLADLLAALTRGDEHVVMPSGLFVRTDRPEFARLAQTVIAAADLRERRAGGGPGHEAGQGPGRLRVAADDLGTWAELSDLGAVDALGQDWVRRARALRDLVDLPEPDPVGLVSTLRPYQLEGLRWLLLLWQHGLGGILADDMGLGKTLQVLALVAHARAAAPEAPPFLVVAPTSVVSAWAGEAARHAPHLRVRCITASGARRAESLAEIAADADIVVTTYTLLRLESEQYAGSAWSGLILDEAQQVKNHQSKAYAAVSSIDAPFRLAVTGTPFENRLIELWSLLSITCPGLYPRARTFVDSVVTPVEKQGDVEALGRLTRRIKPFLLRRTKEVVAADLPPKQEQVLEVSLSPKHRKLYDAHLAKERQRVLGLIDDDFDANRVAVLAALTRLRQLALDPALLDDKHADVGSAKIDDLVEHLREVAAEGHRALVFSQFTGFLGRVRERLTTEGIEIAYLDGRTRDRPRVIEAFRTGTAPAFLISLKAGGVGLTLTEADYVFVLDPWWNPAAEAQAVDRAHRIGQQRNVMVYRLVATNTIEDKVMALKARKAKLFAQVLDGKAGLADGITAADVRGLFD